MRSGEFGFFFFKIYFFFVPFPVLFFVAERGISHFESQVGSLGQSPLRHHTDFWGVMGI